MTQSIYIVDAFTNRPYGGNPAAVCVLEQPADSAWMQSVAAEVNLSDTAFLVPRQAGEWDLRWFTPKVEVALCGHATLASAHVLWHELGIDQRRLRFHSQSGLLTAEREAERIVLDFPADSLNPIPVTQEMVGIFGSEPESLYRGREDLLAQFGSARQVRELAPDMTSLAALDCRGLIATAQGDDAGVDFISRFFGPALGIPEDPVTGSAHCSLAPFWGERLDKKEMRAYQASARGGEVGVRLQGERVCLLGQAVTTLTGELHG